MKELQQEFEKALELFNTKTNENYIQAREMFLSLAENDDDFGEIYSKGYYYAGRCSEFLEEYAPALQYYKNAKKCDSPFSSVYVELGRFYYFGYGVEKDKPKAYNYFCTALKEGNLSSYYYLGLCHKYKAIENPSEEEAFKFLTLGYENSKTRAATSELAYCYADGIGTKADLNNALELLDQYPKNVDFLNRAGNILIKLERYNDARSRFNKILKREQEGSKLYKAAKKAIDDIFNDYEPVTIAKAVANCGDDFSDIEKIINQHPDCNAEAVYDYALNAEKQGLIASAVKLYIVAAAAGCKKAGYTLSNMAAKDTKYFTEIIEYGVK